VIRHKVLLAATIALFAVPGARAVAQETGCALPANPGGVVVFGVVPPDYEVGTEMGWGVEFDQPSESDYASEPVYELDGPAGHQVVTIPFKVPAEGTYTVTAHWTESCGDGVTPDRTVTSRPGTFQGVGPQPPSGGVELRQGGGRVQGGRREPAVALLHVVCPDSRIDEPLRVTARIAGHTIVTTRPHGCLGYKLARSAHRTARRWQMNADDFGARIFVFAPSRLTGHFELRSGDRVVFSAEVRFRPDARGRERVSIVGGARSAAADCGGVPYAPPSNPRVVVSPAAIYAGQEAAFATTDDAMGGSGPTDGSLRFQVEGPAGSASVTGDKDFRGFYTPPAPGHYTVVGSWRQYDCADGDRTTYFDVSTPPAGFDVLAGIRATSASFRTSRRRKAPNSPGDATLRGFLNCPPARQASSDDTTAVVYYERGSSKPTHSSPHLRVTVRGGCDGNHDADPRRHAGKGFHLVINRNEIAATATAPTRLRVLMEFKVAGALVGRSYGTFVPVRTGESVRRG
jgi:hypothetical protein